MDVDDTDVEWVYRGCHPDKRAAGEHADCGPGRRGNQGGFPHRGRCVSYGRGQGPICSGGGYASSGDGVPDYGATNECTRTLC